MKALGFADKEAAVQWDRRYGPLIRKALREWCGRDDEVGRMVYVGTVRLHAGIPRPLEGRFAGLLFELAEMCGLSRVASVSATEMQAMVEDHFAGASFGAQFLSTPPGRAMIDSCAAHLDRSGWPGRVDRGLLDAEPGYRPGFLTSLVDWLERLRGGRAMGRADKPMCRLILPRLFLDTETCEIGLQFPGVHQRPTVRYQLNQGDRLLDIRCEQLVGHRFKPSHGELRGTVGLGHNTQPWSIPAWPRAGAHWALFATDGAFLGAQGDRLNVEADTYFLAIRDRKLVSPKAVRGSLGFVEGIDPNDFGYFELLEVQLDAASAKGLDGLIFGDGCLAAAVSLDDQTTRFSRLGRFAGRHIVVGSQVLVRVEPWSPDHSRTLRLTHERDGSEADITTKLTQHEGHATVQIDGPAHHGSLRLERRGRHVTRRSGRDQLAYTLWPEDCSVKLDQPLYGFDEMAVLRVMPTGTTQAQPTGDMSIPAPQTLVTVQLTVPPTRMRNQPHPLELRVTVPRAELTCPAAAVASPGINQPVVIDPAMFESSNVSMQRGQDLLGDFAIRVRPRMSGDTGESWTLGVETIEGEWVELVSGSAPTVPGTRRIVRVAIAFSTIRDALGRLPSPVGSYRLEQVGRRVSVGGLHLDTQRLAAGDWTPPPSWPGWLGESLAADLGELLSLQQSGEVAFVRTDEATQPLRPVLEPWRRLARVLAGQEDSAERASPADRSHRGAVGDRRRCQSIGVEPYPQRAAAGAITAAVARAVANGVGGLVERDAAGICQEKDR